MSNQDTIYLKNIHIKNTEIREDTIKIRGQLDTIIAQGGGGGTGGTGLNLESTQVKVLAGITSGFDLLHSDLTSQLTVNLVDVSGLASQATLSDTYNLLNDNIGTGGLSVSITALDGEKITNSVIDTKRGLDVNIINSVGITGSVSVSNFPVEQGITGSVSVLNFPTTQAVSIADAVSVNVLETNSTVYDFTNDSSTMTGADNRFIIDRVRPDSWGFVNDKNQTGSNVFWYSNTVTSPLGAQKFPILHGDLQSLYFVAGINRTSDNEALPFVAVYSPSNIAFYTSRWVYTIDPSEKLIQGEKVLLYYGSDPINIYTNIRHLQLLFNAVASQGPLLETEVCYLMSINTASGLTASSVYYNLYNAGWILNDVNKTHNDYEFNSGIKSKGDLLLSELNVNNGIMDVNVSNIIFVDSTTPLNVNITNTDVPVSNTALTYMSYKEVSAGTYGLEVVNRNVQQSTNYLFVVDDITITDETPTIDVRTFRLMSVFGDSTHSGGGSHDIVVQYSTNSTTWYDSPNVVPTNGSGKFAVDLKDFCVSYIRFRFQVALDTLNMNVCLK
jgi:hypothetical protein